jgi:hypothetical protein
VAIVEVNYIGGYEGFSEYWWLRISPDGKRTQVGCAALCCGCFDVRLYSYVRWASSCATLT